MAGVLAHGEGKGRAADHQSHLRVIVRRILECDEYARHGKVIVYDSWVVTDKISVFDRGGDSLSF